MTTPFTISPDVATLFHVGKYMDHHPHADMTEIVEWANSMLPHYFPWAIVTPYVEQKIVERLALKCILHA